MGARLNQAPQQRWLLLAALLAAIWPVFAWMGRRAVDGSDEPWGIVALGLLALLLRTRRCPTPTRLRASLLPSACCLLAYAASYGALSPLPRGLLAMAALGLYLGPAFFGRRLDGGVFMLCLLCLPLMASAQFFGGYPLRLLVAEGAAALLRLGGDRVLTDGVNLMSGEHVVVVDAPCSGMKMLWTGGVAASFLVALRRLPLPAAGTALGGAFVVLLGANIARATALFQLETRNFTLWNGAFEPSVWHSEWLHSAIGLVSFAGALGLMAISVSWLQRRTW